MRSKTDQQAAGLGPDHLESNSQGPTPGRFAPTPAPAPGPGNPDQLPPGSTTTAAAADVEDQGDDSGSRPGLLGRLATPTPVKDIRSAPFETVAGGLFRALGGLVNNRVQVDDQDTSFLTDYDDEGMFAPAAGRIMGRHVPIPDGADVSELQDIGVAVVALVNWAAKGLIHAWDARAEKRRARAVLRGRGTNVYQPPAEGDQQ